MNSLSEVLEHVNKILVEENKGKSAVVMIIRGPAVATSLQGSMIDALSALPDLIVQIIEKLCPAREGRGEMLNTITEHMREKIEDKKPTYEINVASDIPLSEVDLNKILGKDGAGE